LAVTGDSRREIYVICSTGKSRQKEKMITVVDEFDEEAIKRLIYNFRMTEKTTGYFNYSSS
jgi:hypothetical protein